MKNVIVISTKCYIFATRYSQLQQSPTKSVKEIIKIFKNFRSVKIKVKRNKLVVNNKNIESQMENKKVSKIILANVQIDTLDIFSPK